MNMHAYYYLLVIAKENMGATAYSRWFLMLMVNFKIKNLLNCLPN